MGIRVERRYRDIDDIMHNICTKCRKEYDKARVERKPLKSGGTVLIRFCPLCNYGIVIEDTFEPDKK